MRTHKIGDATVEYPDEIGFCFNPVVINIYGHSWSWIGVTVTDTLTNEVYNEKRALFKGPCFFDVSFYMQSSFDTVEFSKIDYSLSGAQDSRLGRVFSVEVDMYSSDNTVEQSFQFNTFIIWGTMAVGERYNGNRTLTWFNNFPFSVGMYTAGAGSVNVTADGVSLPAIKLTERKVYNLMLNDINVRKELILNLPATSTGANVFDNTFDLTFRALTNVASTVRLLVDDCTEDVYLRWIDRHGFYYYWLFKRGDESKQVSNDGEFIRNNMQDYNYVNGYHGGTGRKQRKIEEDTLPLCAPLVDSDIYDLLFQLALSPVVDMYAGKDVNGVDRWKTVNVSVGSYNKSRAVLQDFVASIILPETRVQSL